MPIFESVNFTRTNGDFTGVSGNRRVPASGERRIPRFSVLWGVAAASIWVSAGMAIAQRHTEEELRSLPRVCLAQVTVNSWLRQPIVPEAERKLWAQRLGEKDYLHFHHFCAGLIDMNRAAAATGEIERAHYYRRALTNFEYVQRNASRAFAMMPEVNLQKGLALRLLGDHAAAAVELREAITLKQDYTPAYAALADLLVDLGDIDSAKELLRHGLSVAPSSKMLATKLAQIESAETKPQ